MIVIGITGGSGSGKGYVCERFGKRGIESLDADAVYRRVSAPGTPCLAELEAEFGHQIIKEDGFLNRPVLSSIVFAKGAENKLARLNSITHKYVIAECERWLSEKEHSNAAAAIIDAPQLFESGLDKRCDFTVAVTADRDERIARIMDRDRITRERAEARVAAQHDDLFFAERCDFVIESVDGSDVEGQLDAVMLKMGIPKSVRGEKTKKTSLKRVIALILAALSLAAVVNVGFKLNDFYGRVTHPVLYSEQIVRYADKYSVPEEIICAVINTESSFDPEAVSPAGAIGLMQITKETFWWLMSKTGEELPVEQLYDPETNIRYGTLFLSLLYDEFGSWDTAFAAYNAGRTRVNGWLEDETVTQNGVLVNIPIKETAEYVVKVNKNIEKYRSLLDENG